MTRTDDDTYQYWDRGSGTIQRVTADSPAAELIEERTSPVRVRKEIGQYHLHDSRTGREWVIEHYGRTGNAFDVSHDGTMLAEGGSYGDAGIRVTDLATGKHRTFYGRKAAKRLPPYRPGPIELRMTRELEQERAALQARKARREEEAALETPEYVELVYVTFEHYGNMRDPGTLRFTESGQPDLSKTPAPSETANALWVRLHNDAPLPVAIPTRSLYPLERDCFYESPNRSKLFGRCDGSEIHVWFSVRSSSGEPIPYGFDFGASAVVLPDTSVVFPVPRSILENGNVVVFAYSFRKEDPDDVFAGYGEAREIRFSESDLLDDERARRR